MGRRSGFPLACRREPGVHLGGVHLPPHALFARRFLLRVEVLEPSPLPTQPLVEAYALDLVPLARRVHGLEAGLDLGQAS